MFDEQKARDHIEFLQLTKLTGDFFGRPFVLLPWQRQTISDVYGTVDEDGRRIYKTVYLEIPKKNGKTELVASIALDHIVNDPPGGEVYCCAAEKGQAALVYKAVKSKIDQDEYLSSALKITDSIKEIYNPETGTFLRVLSSEAYSKHGINPTVVIFDELHAQKTRDLWDTMTFASGSARKEPLLYVITTAGDDPDRHSIGWEQHEYARKVRDGELIDPTWYVKIFGAPEDADIYDEKLWYEVNPSLGVTISIDVVRQEAQQAKNSEKAERLFRWLRLNQWVSTKQVGWLPITVWDKTDGSWTRDDMLGKSCYVGIDLSSKIDLSAIDVLFPPEDDMNEWRYFENAWCPEETIHDRARQDHVPYEEWMQKKYINATPGSVVDYIYLKNYIEYLEKNYKVKYYCGDPWHLEFLRQLLSRDVQRKFVEIPQTYAGMSAGMGELERLFRSEKISHEHNPLGRWCFGNVRVSTDGNENQKPMKNKSIDRIDPTVALINAISGAVKLEKKRSVYNEHGVRCV